VGGVVLGVLVALHQRAGGRRIDVCELLDGHKVVHMRVLFYRAWKYRGMNGRVRDVGPLVQAACHGHNVVVEHAVVLADVELTEVEDAWDAHLSHAVVVGLDRVERLGGVLVVMIGVHLFLLLIISTKLIILSACQIKSIKTIADTLCKDYNIIHYRR
jgi:hypothetical protein